MYTADGGQHSYRVFGIVDISVQGRRCQVRAIELPLMRGAVAGGGAVGGHGWHVAAQEKKLVPNPRSPEKPLLPLC